MHSLLRIIQLSIKTEYLKAGITRKIIVLAFNTLCILSLINIVIGSHPQMYDGWPTDENNAEELVLINYRSVNKDV